MIDWKKRQYPAGTPVRVFESDGKTLIGEGVLVKDFTSVLESNPPDAPLIDLEDLDAVAECLEGFDIPEIKMDDGSVIQGCDCWWIPVEEVDDV